MLKIPAEYGRDTSPQKLNDFSVNILSASLLGVSAGIWQSIKIKTYKNIILPLVLFGGGGVEPGLARAGRNADSVCLGTRCLGKYVDQREMK
jgi:hypothetical protein